MGGGRGKRARVLMTFSLWNLLYCFCGQYIAQRFHMPSWPHRLLIGHRWHYRLCAHAYDSIPVSFRCFSSAKCQCPRMINCSRVSHCVSHSRMSSALPLCQLVAFVTCARVLGTPAEVHDPSEFTLGRGPF